MNKQIVKSMALGEAYEFYRHPSGLGILLYPMPGFSSVYAVFATNYGSVNTTFKTQKEDDYVTVPEGIAHFLEHKLFESEEGDAFEQFSKTGALANAFTSFEKTSYLFSTTDHFEECLEILVRFVQDPYFTQQTVEKEQGIIGQEIRMYDDDPGWRVFFNLLCALYHNHPVRIDIAGTTESIAQIDADLLYRCHRTFYNLNNMVLCIAGNFHPGQAMEIIQRNLKAGEKLEVSSRMPEEPAGIVQAEREQELEVSIPLFNLGYKETPAATREQELSIQLQYELILCAVAGKGSALYRELYDEGLINDTFGKEVFCGQGYLANIFSGESRDPRQVRDRIRGAFSCARETGIDEKTFERIRKMLYGAAVISFNDVESVANELVTAYFTDHSIYDTLDVIAHMRREDVNALLSRSFRPESLALSIISPVGA